MAACGPTMVCVLLAGAGSVPSFATLLPHELIKLRLVKLVLVIDSVLVRVAVELTLAVSIR